MENICFPVHNTVPGCPGFFLLGFMIAGWGTFPPHGVIHSTSLYTMSRLRNTSRFVNRREPSSVSCTMPITGRFPCAVMIRRGTAMSSCASAIAGSVWRACRFICGSERAVMQRCGKE